MACSYGAPSFSRSDKIIGCGCNLTEADIGDMECYRHRFLRIVFRRGGYEKPEFGGLIPSKDDHGPIRRDGIGTDNVEHRVMRSIDVDRDHPIEAALVQKPNRIGVANRSVAQFHGNRIAVMQYVDVEQRSRQQGIQHDGADGSNHCAIDDGTWPDDTIDWR